MHVFVALEVVGRSCWPCWVALAPFVAQGDATWDAIRAYWSAEVYIPELNSRLWRFLLQVYEILDNNSGSTDCSWCCQRDVEQVQNLAGQRFTPT